MLHRIGLARAQAQQTTESCHRVFVREDFSRCDRCSAFLTPFPRTAEPKQRTMLASLSPPAAEPQSRTAQSDAKHAPDALGLNQPAHVVLHLALGETDGVLRTQHDF